MESWMLGPPLLIGEKVFYTKHGFIVSGTVKWLGRLQEAFGNQMVAGLVLDEPIQGGGCDGSFGNRRLFRCPPNCGLFAPMNDIVKHEDFLFANPGFALMKNDTNPMHHKYDNLDHLGPHHHHHYQNHFFATIYDSDGANGGGPEFFERQNSTGAPEIFDRQNSLGESEDIIRERKSKPKYQPNETKIIPLGPTCGQDTYKNRVEQRRKRVVKDLNVSLTQKYKLQPADYSPPNTLIKENLSAISGPSLPSGSYLSSFSSNAKDIDDEPLYKSSESSDSNSEEDESTLSYSSVSRSKSNLTEKNYQVIKPKERLGQIFQPKTIQSKNSLMEIGTSSEAVLISNNNNNTNYQISRSDSNATGVGGNFQLSKSDTMKGIQPIEDETMSNAPTVLIGFEQEERLLEVRPMAHIPGKRKAPRPPPPPQDSNITSGGATGNGSQHQLSSSTTLSKKVTGSPPESNYERLGRVAKVNKVQKVESQQEVSPQMSHVSPHQVSQMSPRLWFKKKQQQKKDADITATMPHQGLSKSKSSSKIQNSKSNQIRPVSLLASISDFDREAAKIVQQRQKDEEARKRVNDEAFYCIPADTNLVQNTALVTNTKNNPENDDNAQEALDEIMANVEQKMECLDAIGKHNQRWEKRMNNSSSNHVVEVQRESIPSIDMSGLVSDLNQFLNTTKKELMTPKTKRKHQLELQKQEELVEQQQQQQKKQLDHTQIKMENSATTLQEQEQAKQVVLQVQQQNPTKNQSPPPPSVVKPKPKQELQTPVQQKSQRQKQQQPQVQSKMKNPSVASKELQSSSNQKQANPPQRQLRTRNQVSNNANPNNNHQQQIHEYEDTWNCTKCTLINSTKTNICILCGASFLNSVVTQQTKQAVDLQDLHQEMIEDKSIFDPPIEHNNENNSEEQMPVKGNVLDRVVQFTAIQMAATERPTSAMTSWMELSPRNSMADLEPRPMSAIGSIQSSRPQSSEIFVPTPVVVHRMQNKNNNIEVENNQKRLSVLEKEETTEIIAKWKKEHEEREKARRDFFESMAKEKSAPKDSVVETQAALLEQAKRKLELQNNNKQVVKDNPNLNPKKPTRDSQKFHQGLDKTDSSLNTYVQYNDIDKTNKNSQNNSKGNADNSENNSHKNVQTNRSAKGAIESLGHANNQKRLKTVNDPVINEILKSNSRQSENNNRSNNNKRKKNTNNTQSPISSSKANTSIDHDGNVESKNHDGGGVQKFQGQNNNRKNNNNNQQKKSPKAAAALLKNDSQGQAKKDNVIDTTINGQGDKTSTGQVAPNAGQGSIQQTPSRSSKSVNNKANLAANINEKSNQNSEHSKAKVSNDQRNTNIVTTNGEKADVSNPNKKSLPAMKFDPSKTPSSFMKLSSPENETTKKVVPLPDCIDPHPEVSNEAMRKKRLEYFESIPNSQNSVRSLNTKSNTATKKSEVKKILEEIEDIKDEKYDIPISPPRQVPESFFASRNLPYPLISRKNVNTNNNNNSSRRFSTTSTHSSNSTSTTDYEPIMIDAKKNDHSIKDEHSKAAAVVKTKPIQKSKRPIMTKLTSTSESECSSSVESSKIREKYLKSKKQQGNNNGNNDNKQDWKNNDVVQEESKIQRIEIQGLKLSGASSNSNDIQQPKRPARNKMRRSQIMEIESSVNSSENKKSQKQKNNANNSNEKIVPAGTNISTSIASPSTRRADEIDDMLVRKVDARPRQLSPVEMTFENTTSDILLAENTNNLEKHNIDNIVNALRHQNKNNPADITKKSAICNKKSKQMLIKNKNSSDKDKDAAGPNQQKNQQPYNTTAADKKSRQVVAKIDSKSSVSAVSNKIEQTHDHDKRRLSKVNNNNNNKGRAEVKKQETKISSNLNADRNDMKRFNVESSRPVESSSSSTSSLDSTIEFPKKSSKNHGSNNFNGQKLVNSIELKRRTGAIPKKQQARKGREIQSSEIVDDVLYISGPVKIPSLLDNAPSYLEKKPAKNSGNGNDPHSSSSINKMLAFPLIPSDKFDPEKSTLSRKNKLDHEISANSQNNAFSGSGGVVDGAANSRMQDIHVEATVLKSRSPEKIHSSTGNEHLDIMERLERAINAGNHKEAALLAKEVSKLQISTKLSLKELSEKRSNKTVEKISLNMYVEDRTSYNGPVQVSVKPTFTLAELKEQVQCEFEIPVDVQRWILGKSLAEDDQSTLASHGINKSGESIYLYLVAPKESGTNGSKDDESTTKPDIPSDKPKTVPTDSKKLPDDSEEPPRKGRYWNYEMDRWSYCSSDDEEEDDNIEAKNAIKENSDDEEGEESEWEYEYEDAELKPEQAETDNAGVGGGGETKSELKLEAGAAVEAIIPERLKPLVLNVGTKSTKPDSTAVAGKTQRVNPRDGWECPTCTLLNEPTRPGCEACTTERPKDYVQPPPGPADTLPKGATAITPIPTTSKAKTENVVEAPKTKNNKEKDDILKNYKKLDDLDLIPNAETFECIICYLDIEPGDGVVLRECLHTFCKECLSGAIEHCDAPQVACPYKDDNYSCDMTLLDREIKALVSPTLYEKHQQKSLKEAQVTAKNSFHCKTPDCQGWCFITDNINSFKCPICKRLNCITCQAIHEGQDCKQYQKQVLNESQDENSKKTKDWIEGLIATGEALNCPNCQVILLKKWGCDWVRCTYCRTEICWVTKQLRWGPNGRGDTSAGCKCMADGRTKCHPLCNYCH